MRLNKEYLPDSIPDKTEVSQILQQEGPTLVQQVLVTNSTAKLIHHIHTFLQEYNNGDIVTLCNLPAKARVRKVTLRCVGLGFNWSYYDPDLGGELTTSATFDVGTPQNPKAFSNQNLQENVIDLPNGSAGYWVVDCWHREEEASSVQLTFNSLFGDPTVGLNGKSLEFWIDYIQEE